MAIKKGQLTLLNLTDSSSYWLNISSGIHMGANQSAAIVITPMRQAGNNAPETDTTAVIEIYKGNSAVEENKISVTGYLAGECTISVAVIASLAENIYVVSKRNGNVVDSETITYCPMTTPTIDLTNDMAVVSYNEKRDNNGNIQSGQYEIVAGQKIETTANLYLSGSIIPATAATANTLGYATYKWYKILADGTETEINAPAAKATDEQKNALEAYTLDNGKTLHVNFVTVDRVEYVAKVAYKKDSAGNDVYYTQKFTVSRMVLGSSLTISSDGYWEINGTKTNSRVQGNGVSDNVTYYKIGSSDNPSSYTKKSGASDTSWGTTYPTPTKEKPYVASYTEIVYTQSDAVTTDVSLALGYYELIDTETKYGQFIEAQTAVDATKYTATSANPLGQESSTNTDYNYEYYIERTTTIAVVNGVKQAAVNSVWAGPFLQKQREISIVSITEYYKVTNNLSLGAGETFQFAQDGNPANGWVTEDNIPTPDANNQFLWNCEVTKYNYGKEPFITTPIIIVRYTKDGEAGRGIQSIANKYLLSKVTTKPEYTTNDSSNTSYKGTWGTYEAPTADWPYLWNYEEITYTTGDPSKTEIEKIAELGVTQELEEKYTFNTYYANLSIENNTPSADWEALSKLNLAKGGSDNNHAVLYKISRIVEKRGNVILNSAVAWSTPVKYQVFERTIEKVVKYGISSDLKHLNLKKQSDCTYTSLNAAIEQTNNTDKYVFSWTTEKANYIFKSTDSLESNQVLLVYDRVQNLSLKGEWASETTYGIFDVVYYNGTSYVSKCDNNKGTTPGTDATKWTILSEAGVAGQDATSYWIDIPEDVHTGIAQTKDIVIKAFKQTGEGPIEADTNVKYYINDVAQTSATVAGNVLTISVDSIKSTYATTNITVKAAHVYTNDGTSSEVIYDTEVIDYSPSTPIITLTQDAAQIKKASNGVYSNASTTANLYLEGTNITDQATSIGWYKDETKLNSTAALTTNTVGTYTVKITYNSHDYTKTFMVSSVEDAVNYWLHVSAPVHKGKNQTTEITAVAYVKVGSFDEKVDTTATVQWKYAGDEAYGDLTSGKLPVELNNKNIIIIAKHGSTIYDSEEITYTPDDIPVIDLSSDTITVPCNANGTPLTSTEPSSTATVYFNGSEVASGLTYAWSIQGGTIKSGAAEKTVKVNLSDLTDYCVVTCVATYSGYKTGNGDAITLTKSFTISKQYQGEKGESLFALHLSNDYDAIPCTNNGDIAATYNYANNTKHAITASKGNTALDLEWLPTTEADRVANKYYVKAIASNVTFHEVASPFGAYVTALTADTGKVEYSLISNGTTIATATFNLSKVYAGEDGNNAVDYWFEINQDKLIRSNNIASNGTFSTVFNTETITGTVYKQIGETLTAYAGKIKYAYAADKTGEVTANTDGEFTITLANLDDALKVKTTTKLDLTLFIEAQKWDSETILISDEIKNREVELYSADSTMCKNGNIAATVQAKLIENGQTISLDSSVNKFNWFITDGDDTIDSKIKLYKVKDGNSLSIVKQGTAENPSNYCIIKDGASIYKGNTIYIEATAAVFTTLTLECTFDEN